MSSPPLNDSINLPRVPAPPDLFTAFQSPPSYNRLAASHGAAASHPRGSTVIGIASRSGKRLSFQSSDEFFHGMISYRVRAEGPAEKGGNNLARLIYEACCGSAGTKIENNEVDGFESLKQFSEALRLFGKWPKAFSGHSEPIRIFLDQVNLRMGVPWKGTGDADNGGFLGAVSRALLLVPLFSATPARFKVVCTGSPERYALNCPINMTLTNGTELLSAHIDEATGTETIRRHVCEGIHADGTFQLSAVTDEIASDFPSEFMFFSTGNFLPSDGSGPRGSLADMLTIMQKPEELTFTVVSCSSEGHVVLQVDELTDHIFFYNESISLTVSYPQSSLSESFKIIQVMCQGSKVGALHSKIKIEAGKAHVASFSSSSSPIPGSTKEIDRCDNFLMELLLTRALRTLAAVGNLHACKLIMPVFVDDMDDLLYPMSSRLSEQISKETSTPVKKALEAILKRTLTRAEEEEWVNTSVKAAVKFFFDFQGLTLSDKVNRCKTMKEKASLVYKHTVTTVGIEANNIALFQYVSNNPLAQELLDFLDDCGLMHLHPVLIKNDITSVKEVSLLSKSAIAKIADDGHQLSARPLMKETVEITRAVSSAALSKLALPVSTRLATFEDQEASFLTVIYSSQAIYLAVQKPFFNLWLPGFFFCVALGVLIDQMLNDPINNLPFVIPNIAVATWMALTLFCSHVLGSNKASFQAWIFGCFTFGSGFLAGIPVDKILDSKVSWADSKICSSIYQLSPVLDPRRYESCVYFLFFYFGFSAILGFVLVCCLMFRQSIFWRICVVGFSVRIWLATAFDYSANKESIASAMGCILFPMTLIVTETLRFYGKLQALQITTNDAIVNSIGWENILDDSREDLKKMAETLSNAYGHTVVDRSMDLGKWISGTTVKPLPIRQPITDFDELYKVASVINNTFQIWIESFFGSDLSSATFLYLDDVDNLQDLQNQLRKETFHGFVSRGPVKLPERAIAKVFQSIRFRLLLEFSDVCAQVYRTYGGDVSLITDIVRCAVEFENVSDMSFFVQNWISKYGRAHQNARTFEWTTKLRNETRDFFRIFGKYFRSAGCMPKTCQQCDQPSDATIDHSKQSIDQGFHLFEILRIRNRLDPALIDVPGGYRDLAFKLKIGFVRYAFK
jgi:hypothetical protein